MSEFQAALGLLQLKHVNRAIRKRKEIAKIYRDSLKDIEGIVFLNDLDSVNHNYSYFPILVDQLTYGKTRDEVYQKLRVNGIYGRRYFYPLISNFSTYKSLESADIKNLPIANKIANKVICLPIYPDLEIDMVNKICKLFKSS
jgi:dTDP-4-amino-4,6-dideoxygalactose transaminase